MAATKTLPTDNHAGGPYSVPPEPRRWPSIALAVGVHALLLAFLVIGVSWQNHEPVAVEAEVWDMKTETAAPPPPPPTPQPEPEPQPDTPPPPPEPTPKAVEPPPPPVEQPVVKQPAPDIALARENKRKEELKRKQQQEEDEREKEQERLDRIAEQKRIEAKEAKEAKQAAEKKERALAEQKAKEQKAQEQKAKELAQKQADEKKQAEKEKADKLAKAKAAKAEQAKLDKQHDEDVKRMMAAAAGNGSANSTGSAEKSSAPHRDAGYIAAITAKVKGNSSYGGDDPGNPVVTFHVDQLPTGEIISVRKTKSSGVPAFDDAVERAIKASSPLPKKKDGTVERSLEINFKMKEMQ